MDKEIWIPVNEREWIDRAKFAIGHWATRLVQRIVISNYKNLHKTDYIPRSPYEKEAISICRNLIINKESDLRVDPEIGESYITNESLKMFVFINEDSVDIIKNKFPHNVPLSPKAIKTVTRIFNKHAHIDRAAYKNEVFSNLKLSLEIILEETKTLNKIK